MVNPFFYVPNPQSALLVNVEIMEYEVALLRDREVAPLSIKVTISHPRGDSQEEIWNLFLRHDP